MLTEAQAAPEKVSERVHHGPEFRVTWTDRHCECRVWLDSAKLCFHSANLKSLFPSQLNQDLKERCLSSKTVAVKSSGEWFPGGRALLRKQRWAVEGGAGEVVISQTAPREPSFRHRTAREAQW